MYYPHFGLQQPPFKITPNTDFFFSGGNRGAILDALVYAIENGEGIIKVVGEVGSGKTMLCRMLQTILPETIESIYLANPSVAPEDVLHAIAFELQLPLPKDADRLNVMQALQTHLLKRHAEGRQVVIFVEEAQGMPLATLEEIRLLSNLETKQDKLLQIVLFGQPELDENLNKEQIRQLRERITHRFNLSPLQTKDVGEYLIFRLRAAGYHGPHLFTNASIKKLSKAAQGLVRRVNILADKALLAAFADNVYQVTPKHVKAAIQDSEFAEAAYSYQWGRNKALTTWLISLLLIMVLGVSATLMWQMSAAKQGQAQLVQSPAKSASTPELKAQMATNQGANGQGANSQVTAASTGVNPDLVKPAVTEPLVAQPSNPAVLNPVVLNKDALNAAPLSLGVANPATLNTATLNAATANTAASVTQPSTAESQVRESAADKPIAVKPGPIKLGDQPAATANLSVAAKQSTVAVTNLPVSLNKLPTLTEANHATLAKPAAGVDKQVAKVAGGVVNQRIEAMNKLLQQAGPETVLLQIKSISAKSALDAQNVDRQVAIELENLSQQVELDNIYLYRMHKQDGVYTVLLYGAYAQRAEALEALKGLPNYIKNSRPYLRTLAGISRDVAVVP